MAFDDGFGHVFKPCRPPHRIAIFIDDGRANALDEIMSGNARQRNAVILLEALLDAVE